MPTRACLKNTGPRESSLIPIAISTMSGELSAIPINDTVKSRLLFTTRRQELTALLEMVATDLFKADFAKIDRNRSSHGISPARIF